MHQKQVCHHLTQSSFTLDTSSLIMLVMTSLADIDLSQCFHLAHAQQDARASHFWSHCDANLYTARSRIMKPCSLTAGDYCPIMTCHATTGTKGILADMRAKH